MSLPLQCPVCRAAVDGGPQCRRCRVDLSLLLTLGEQRDRALQTAYYHAAHGDWERALAIARGVEAWRTGPDVGCLLAAGYLLHRDYARAWQWLSGSVKST